MIPEKLFSPKCLHTDRNVVFHEDFEAFYNYFLIRIKDEIKLKLSIEDSNIIDEHLIINTEEILNYKVFKNIWNEKKMSFLHFSKSKEENLKEYYEVLFGEVQYNLMNNILSQFANIHKIISIFSMYSLYYTQTTDFFYQINTIPEILLEINEFIKTLQYKYTNRKIVKQLLVMMNRLYEDDAFSMGVIIGLKTIILNKYGLPMEQKQKVYKEYSDINESLKILNKSRNEKKEKVQKYKGNLDEYFDIKRQTVDLIKDLGSNEAMTNLYCDFINKRVYSGDNMMYLRNNFDLLNLSQKDLGKNDITNLDLQFNQLDNNMFMFK